MHNKLKSFAAKISNLTDRSKSEQIDLFAYFLVTEMGATEFMPADVAQCFDLMNMPTHTNISSYLSKQANNKKSKKYIRKKTGYVLTKSAQESFDKAFEKPAVLHATDALYPREILEDTRKTLEFISEQARACYDYGLYDPCAVMLRKLIEVLIIEAFERYGIDDKIKDGHGNFLYLSELVDKLLEEKKWNIGRNAKQGFAHIKRAGDMSAHNRRYTAKKSDIDGIKGDIRVCIEELVDMIDYPAWNKELASK